MQLQSFVRYFLLIVLIGLSNTTKAQFIVTIIPSTLVLYNSNPVYIYSNPSSSLYTYQWLVSYGGPFTSISGPAGTSTPLIYTPTSSVCIIKLDVTYMGITSQSFSTTINVDYTTDTLVYFNTAVTDTLECAGGALNVAYNTSFPFQNGNIFTVQLSNATGSFANAVNIGSATATTGGNISCTIPANTPSGAGYRYRVIATSPADTSLADGNNMRIISGAVTATNLVCVGDTVKLAANDTGTGITYSWASPNGFTSTNNKIIKPSSAYSDSGAYYLTESAPGCSVKDTTHISLKVAPAKPVAGSNSAVCKGAAIDLTGSASTSGITWQWTGPNSFSSTAQNPGITPAVFADTGYYIVKVTLNGCTKADTTHVAVLPYPDTVYVTGKTTICAGDSLILNGNAPNAGVVYNWTGPNGINTGTQNIAIANATTINAGSYYLSASLGNSCALIDTINVQVLLRPALTLADTLQVCQGGSLSLSTGAPTTGVAYNWTGPGFTANTQNPVITGITTADSGKYFVTATANGCSTKDSTFVTVNATPVIGALTYSNPLCAGDSIKIICPVLPPLVTYSWAGPNGFTSVQQNVTIAGAIVANTGNYILTVTKNGCATSDTASVTVNPLPAKPVISSNSPVCASTLLSFNPVGTIGATYVWSGPTGFSSLIKNATRNVAVTDSGSYIVKATLNGCSASDTTHVIVSAAPANVTYSSNSPICVGDTLKVISNTTTTGVAYGWTGPNGYSTAQQNFNINNATAANAGKYALTLTYNACVLSDTVTVVVKPLPIVPVVGSNSPVCTGASLNLTATSSAGATFVWTGPNSFGSNTQNPSVSNVTIAAAGSYTAKATLNGCSVVTSTGSTTVTINVTPTGTATSNSPVCTGDTLQLTGNGTPAGVSYHWTGPNGFGSTQQNPALYHVLAAAAGTYSLSLSLNGCTATTTNTVSITPNTGAPVITIATPKDTVCGGDATVFTATASNAGSNPVYTWRINGATVFTGNPYTTTGLAEGNVVLCSIKSNAACQPVNTATSNSISMEVQASHPPPVTITVYPQVYNPGIKVTFTAISTGSSNCLSYQWRVNGVNITGATSSSFETYSLTKGDKVSLYIHSSCACTNPDTLLTNAIGLGVSSARILNGFSIYPNPAQKEVSITTTGNTLKATIAIYDMSGRVMLQQEVSFVNGEVRVPLSLAAGVYMVELVDKDGGKNIQRLSVL